MRLYLCPVGRWICANGTVRKLVVALFVSACVSVLEFQLDMCECYSSQTYGHMIMWRYGVGVCARVCVELKVGYMRMVPFASWYMVSLNVSVGGYPKRSS